MSSDRDINSKLDDVAIALTDIVSRIQAVSRSTSSELERARNAVRSLIEYISIATVRKSRMYN